VIIDSLYDATSKVIDIGCGNGLLTRKIASKFKEIYSIDINKKRLENLKRLCCENNIGNVHVMEMSAYKLEYMDNQFDLAIFYRSVDHIADYERAITEAYRVLKKGKMIYINVANTRKTSKAIECMNELREFEDELFEYLGTSEGMCEFLPVNIDLLIEYLRTTGLKKIEQNDIKIEESKVREYYQNVINSIREMMKSIETKSESQYETFLKKFEDINTKIENNGYDLLPLVEITGTKK